MFKRYHLFLKRLAYVVGVLAVFTAPVVATSGVWTWKDHSALLPYKDGVTVSLASENQNQWLVSDGLRLYRFDGASLLDITSSARTRGISTISGIYSDGHSWLVFSQPANQADSSMWLTDGDAVWTDVSGKFSNQGGALDAAGSNSEWYFRTYRRATAGSAAGYDVWYWNGLNMNASQVTLPAELAAIQAGCFKYLDGSKLCTGANAPIHLNNTWYFFGGSAEALGAEGHSTQSAKGGVWTMNGQTLTPLTGAPAFKFISGVWPSKNSVLIATSNATSNPFAADHLWLFDGTNWKDVSSSALSVGLFSKDAREIRAVYTGRSWFILAGKQQIRFDGTRMALEDKTRDLFQLLSSNENGLVVLGGVASEADSAVPSAPLTARLATITEDLSAPAVSIPLVSGVVTEVMSNVYGPSVHVSGNPTDPHIGNGKIYVFHASAESASGVVRVDIYVNGARVKSCTGNTCEYQQKYWTNGSAVRKVNFSARAIDTLGYVKESDKVSLIVDTNIEASAYAVSNQDPTMETDTQPLVPAGQLWNKDSASNVSWTSWLQNAQGVQIAKNGVLPLLMTGSNMTYGVSASDKSGIGKIDVWVNGAVKKECVFYDKKESQVCAIDLAGADYPYGTEVFVNANVFAGNGKSVWTTGTRIKRDTNAAPIVASVVTPNVASTTTQLNQAFQSIVSVTPNATEIERGTRVKVAALSQNNTLGLARVDLYLNGKMVRSCTYGAAVSQVLCDLDIDTASYQPGTTLTVMANAIDNSGHDMWSNAKSMTIKTISAASSMGAAQGNGMSVWAWLGPAVTELSEGQTATYSVGSWSPKGLSKIDVIVDGAVRRTCIATSPTGAQECSFTITTSDYNHGHTVQVNARVMDNAGRVMWSDPRAITIKRTWEPLSGSLPYVGITLDHEKGYSLGEVIRLQARGWSGASISRLEIYANGTRVAACSSESCTWSSGAYVKPSLEYTAHLIDGAGQDVWTPALGVYAK